MSARRIARLRVILLYIVLIPDRIVEMLSSTLPPNIRVDRSERGRWWCSDHSHGSRRLHTWTVLLQSTAVPQTLWCPYFPQVILSSRSSSRLHNLHKNIRSLNLSFTSYPCARSGAILMPAYVSELLTCQLTPNTLLWIPAANLWSFIRCGSIADSQRITISLLTLSVAIQCLYCLYTRTLILRSIHALLLYTRLWWTLHIPKPYFTFAQSFYTEAFFLFSLVHVICIILSIIQTDTLPYFPLLFSTFSVSLLSSVYNCLR